jgi:hypothetical protein
MAVSSEASAGSINERSSATGVQHDAVAQSSTDFRIGTAFALYSGPVPPKDAFAASRKHSGRIMSGGDMFIVIKSRTPAGRIEILADSECLSFPMFGVAELCGGRRRDLARRQCLLDLVAGQSPDIAPWPSIALPPARVGEEFAATMHNRLGRA